MPESFFIESSTGESYALNFSGYLGVESIWNNRNYWVNMQDCSKGVMVRSIAVSSVTSISIMIFVIHCKQS